MPLPGQTITIQDPGLGISEPAATNPVCIGVADGGSQALDTVGTVASPDQIATKVGYGPLGDLVGTQLQVAGGPVRFMRMNSSVAATTSAVTQTGADTLIIILGSALDTYDAKVEITKAGGAGVGEFRYSLDGGTTYGPSRLIPAVPYVVVNTGLTITFTLSYTLGNVFSFTTTAPHWNAADLATAMAGLLATTTKFGTIHCAGEFVDGATANTVAAAMASEMTTLENNFKFARAVMMSGKDDAATTIAAWTTEDTRVAPCYSTATRPNTAVGVEGFSTPALPSVDVVGARIADTLVSTDLKRVQSGPLVGVTDIGYDEFANDEGLDAAGFTTLRTWQDRGGFFITNGNIHAPPGSDYQRIHRGRVMDLALTETYKAQALFIGRSVRTVSDPVGAIDPRDAVQLENEVLDKLRNALLAPINAEGTAGYVSEVRYVIDRTNNVLATSTILATLSIRPRGDVDFVNTVVGYVAA